MHQRIEPVAIAHLSDIHIGPLIGFTPRHWNLKRALGYINWQRKRRGIHLPEVAGRLVADLLAQPLDHVAITGDLANLGLPAEHARAREWLSAIGPADRVSVVPGNHDIYAELGDDPGPLRWHEFMRSDADGKALAADADFPFVRRIGPVALVGVNSAVPTPPAIATGRVGAEQRQRLADVLARLGEAGLFRLVMIHHPPLPGLARRRHELEDAVELERLLIDHGAELVIHGHNHTSTTHWRRSATGRSMAVVGVPSSSVGWAHNGEPLARYHIYRIRWANGPWSITVEERGLAAPVGRVVALATRELAAEASVDV